MIIYDNYDQIRENVKELAPKVVYKYRADWNNPLHKEMVTNQNLWFANPKDLNDLFDIRIPLQFDYSEVDSPLFYDKLKKDYLYQHQSIILLGETIENICREQLKLIKNNPKTYFEKSYMELRESILFDRYGIFSCTINELSEVMWAHYGANNTGFAIGFKTDELAEALQPDVGFGQVYYSDEVMKHSFIYNDLYKELSLFLRKSSQWEYEQEFRFYTMNPNGIENRAMKYPIPCVAEFILGAKFPSRIKQEFIDTVQAIFPSTTKIFELEPQISRFGYSKKLIC
ncbi:DUF2971 domain-containing protein [Cellulophaga sp. BC115SP]|uniref:DUF2971 domain-containing protein n=1 Tax=Cellulophaga sp. BC115SP TaxID=2683263 RepID=UPI0014136941|nr:DUF2971 domain-containing protein [Cellulophaga sp. BC115SP]NBB31825.1 DUF2971 domain-containing protein [Cellulophaga sp. BC115SP]